MTADFPIPAGYALVPNCAHSREQTSVGPTTSQINHFCPDCNQRWTTFPPTAEVVGEPVAKREFVEFAFDKVLEVLRAAKAGTLYLKTIRDAEPLPVVGARLLGPICVLIDTSKTRGLGYKFWDGQRAEREDIKLMSLTAPVASSASIDLATDPAAVVGVEASAGELARDPRFPAGRAQRGGASGREMGQRPRPR